MGTVVANPNRLTLPDIARQMGVSLDTLRARVRRTPEAAAMFDWIGGIRSIDAGRMDEFRRLITK